VDDRADRHRRTSAVYYGLFSFFIRRFNLATMGRETPQELDEENMEHDVELAPATRAAGFIAALGGARNLKNVDACTTRLRLQVVDNALVREADLKALGARGLIKPAPGSVQVVLGPMADSVADEIRGALKAAAAAT
jgi:PTS system N-acetylglucosamine-specific IIC component